MSATALRSRRRLTLLGLLAAVPALAIVPGAAGAQGRVPTPIQRGVVVQPDTVTVGDPFRVVVRVRAPKGATIEFPTAVDSGEKVESLDRASVEPGLDTTVTEQTATYRLAAWDVGRLPIRLPEIVVRDGDVVRRLPFDAALAIEVRSVLPADSTERVPKPPRALFEFGPPWWLWLLVALAALAIVGLLWWLWRRRRRQPAAAPPDAYALAQRDFARVAALDLVSAGETGQYVAIMVDVVRDFLGRTIPAARVSHTTGELAHALRGDARVPLSRLVALLHEADLVKFAGARVTPDRAESLGGEARALVDDVHAALERAREAAAAQVAPRREAA